MDTRHNDLTGASIPPFAGVMDDDPVPDPADALSCTVPSAADSCAGAWIGAVSGGCPRHRCWPPLARQRSVA